MPFHHQKTLLTSRAIVTCPVELITDLQQHMPRAAFRTAIDNRTNWTRNSQSCQLLPKIIGKAENKPEMRADLRASAETLKQANGIGTLNRFDRHRLVPAREAQPTPTANGDRGCSAPPTSIAGAFKVLAANHAIDIRVPLPLSSVPLRPSSPPLCPLDCCLRSPSLWSSKEENGPFQFAPSWFIYFNLTPFLGNPSQYHPFQRTILVSLPCSCYTFS